MSRILGAAQSPNIDVCRLLNEREKYNSIEALWQGSPFRRSAVSDILFYLLAAGAPSIFGDGDALGALVALPSARGF